jgi:hypothetical protein
MFKGHRHLAQRMYAVLLCLVAGLAMDVVYSGPFLSWCLSCCCQSMSVVVQEIL